MDIRFIKKVYYLLTNPFRKLYWFIFRPKKRGVKCFIVHEGKILFVRLGYAHKAWTIPGGGVDKNESFEDAAKREVKEELSIDLDKVEKIGEYLSTKEYKIDTVECFRAKVESPNFKIDGFEIVDAVWAHPDNPPIPSAPRVKMLTELFKQKS